MPIPKEFASAKRFGARYGSKLKLKVAEIDHLKRGSTKCPYCRKEKVNRVAAGIWYCSKCRVKFAGKAYTFAKKRTMQQLAEEMREKEAPAEEEAEEIA
ncbi:50S ribosomal protein L37ae [Candidatus Woesearchaeota archaeon]|nr:50S ribosomal protein L37ae [Candidatus Woesearchaeota archaeon]